MLTRPHRQVIATLAVLTFSIAPTAYIAATAWRLNRPEHLHEVEVELSRALGLSVSIDSVRHPKPGEDILRGVVLRLEKSTKKGSPVGELGRAEVVRLTRSGRSYDLRVEGLALRGDDPASAMTQVGALLRGASGGDWDRISLSARSCSIELRRPAGGRPLTYTLRDLAAILRSERGSPTLSASYLLDGPAAGSRCELTLTRALRGDSVCTDVEFKTMDGPLSAGVLQPFFDAAAWLGPDAAVEGVLAVNQRGNAPWSGTFRGQLLGVDLSALIKHFRNYRLSGSARVEIDEARWAERPGGQGSGWVEARGKLEAGQGAISTDLLRALAAEMKFRAADTIANGNRAEHDFQALGLSFRMASDGQIELGGGLGAAFAPGAVLVQGNRSLPLFRAPEGAANVRGLCKTFFPASADELIPGTPDAQGIFRYLPLPPGRATAKLETN